MKIYAIRDRLIDYFMVPFAAQDDKSVLAAISRTINKGTNNDDISAHPQHFEVWLLGEVDQDGNITPRKEILSPCSLLVRGDLRKIGATAQGGGETHGAAQESEGASRPMGCDTAPHKPPAADSALPTGGPTGEIRQ